VWFYYGIWGVQAVWALLILWRDAYHRDRWKIIGLIAGLAVGFAPFAHIFLPTGTFRIEYPGAHFLYVPLALTAVYGLRRRWALFLLALAFSVGPYAYMLLSAAISTPTNEPFQTFVEIYYHFEPILAGLTGRELAAWYGSRVKKEQSA
jgi:hypothetical protein